MEKITIIDNMLNEVSQVLDQPINVLYVCTMPSKTSTFGKYHSLFYDMIKQFYPNRFQNLYFVSDLEDRGTEALKDLNQDEQFIMSEQILMNAFLDKYNIKFDAIIFAQCSNLEEMFNTGKTRNNIFPFFDKKFYQSLNENGLLINFYYNNNNKDDFVDIQDFYSATSFNNFIFHLFYVDVLNSLFTRISAGIYRKRNISDEQYKKMIEDKLKENLIIKKETIKSLFKNESPKSISEFVNKEYFNQSITKSSYKAFLEKSIQTFSKK